MLETNPNLPTQQRHRNNLNFLRVVLATLVILSHAPELIDGNRHREILTRLFHTISFGELAVDGFFILSGYLIVQSWLRSASVADYLKKRVLRIYPGFIVAYLLSLFVVGPLGAENVPQYFAQINKWGIFEYLVTLNPPLTPTVFVGLPYPGVNGALWTILYEFGCYLLVMLLGITGLIQKRLVIAILFFSMLILNFYMNYLKKHGVVISFPVTFLGMPTVWPRFLAFFLAGSCAYLYRDRIVYRSQWAWLALIGLLLSLFKTPIEVITLPFFGTYLLLYLGLRPIEGLSKIGTKVDLSYGLYLYAWPVQILLVWYFRAINPWLMFLAAFGITVCLAWLSWHIVEKPALSLKRRTGT